MDAQDILAHDSGAEQAIIVSILADNDLLRNIYVNRLKPEDFYKTYNKYIYSTMLKMLAKDMPIQAPDLFQFIKQNEPAKASNTFEYLQALDSSYSAQADPYRYAAQVLKYSHLRQISLLGASISKIGYNKDASIDNIKDKVAQHLFHIENLSEEQNPSVVPLSKLAKEIIDKLNSEKDELSGIKSGYIDLDKIILGFKKSDLVILAGRPAMGKTALATNIMLNITRKKMRTLFFSMEMSKNQITERLLSMESGVDSTKFRKKGDLTRDDLKNLKEISDAWETNNIEDLIIIDDTSMLTLEKIKSRINRLIQKKQPPDLIIIDYLQLLSSSGKFERRDLEISNLTRTLKIIARTNDVPIICLSQLNRECERRVNKRPMLSDLRDSGAIEQDADIVMFIYRDEIYDPKTKDNGIAEIIVSKNRSGTTGTSKLTFRAKYTRFENYFKNQGYNNE